MSQFLNQVREDIQAEERNNSNNSTSQQPVLLTAEDEESYDAATPPVSPQGVHNTSQQSINMTPPSSPNLVLSPTPVVRDPSPPLAGQDPVPHGQSQGVHGGDGLVQVDHGGLLAGGETGSVAAPLAAQDLAPPVQADHIGPLAEGDAGSQESQQQSTPPLSQPSQDVPVNLDDLPMESWGVQSSMGGGHCLAKDASQEEAKEETAGE